MRPSSLPLDSLRNVAHLHGGVNVSRFFAMHLLGALFPITAGVAIYGWRALAVMLIVVASAAAAIWVWRHIGSRGRQLRFSHGLWMALLLSLTLPAHLASLSHPAGLSQTLWPLLPAAGIGLIILTWALGGIGMGRIHPVLVMHLLLVVLFQQLLIPHWVLQRGDMVFGDVLKSGGEKSEMPRKEPWIDAWPIIGQEAVWAEPASQRLIFFTSGTQSPDRAFLSLEGLLRDRMPPLEDLILGGQPAPIGSGSAIAVIIGGLFLLYRGLIDFRIPLLICLFAFIALLVLPVPVVITDSARQWRWLIFYNGVGWSTAVTFANYELMAGPMLFMAFFLATSPAVRPMSRRARAIYAAMVGISAAAAQLYASVLFGPYLALLVVSLLTPMLDRRFAPRTLV